MYDSVYGVCGNEKCSMQVYLSAHCTIFDIINRINIIHKKSSLKPMSAYFLLLLSPISRRISRYNQISVTVRANA